MSVHRAPGVATLEFLIAIVLVMAPLCAALFEVAQLAVSRQLLQLALFEGVRAAAVSGADVEALRGELARGLVPLFGAGRDAGSARAAFLRASVEVRRPELMLITVHAPTRRDFADFGVAVEGDRVIPNEAMSPAALRRAAGGRTLLDANLLDVEVRYCRRLLIPMLDRVIVGALRPFADPRGQLCLAQGRVPIAARAATLMQSDASARRSGLAG